MDLQIEGRQTALRPEWRADIESRVADLHPNHEVTHIRATLTKHDHRKPADSHSVLLGTDVYLHKNAVRDAVLEQMDGMEVSLNVEPGEKGLQATVVQPTPPEARYVDKRSVAA